MPFVIAVELPVTAARDDVVTLQFIGPVMTLRISIALPAPRNALGEPKLACEVRLGTLRRDLCAIIFICTISAVSGAVTEPLLWDALRVSFASEFCIFTYCIRAAFFI